MPRYHLNPAKGPMPCRARKTCPYGDEPHFDSREEAQIVYETALSQANPLPQYSKIVAPDFDHLDSDELHEFAAESEVNYHEVERELELRMDELKVLSQQLENIDQTNFDRATLESLQHHRRQMRRDVIELMSARHESPHHNSPCEQLALQAPNLHWSPNNEGIRDDDVIALALNDFKEQDSLSYWDRSRLAAAVARGRGNAEKNSLTLALRRAIRDHGHAVLRANQRERFAAKNKELHVYDTEGVCTGVQGPGHQTTVSGLLRHRGDNEVSGLLYFGQASNETRLRALHGLYVTGLQFARIVDDEGDVELHPDDPVWPGKFEETMQTYMQKRVNSWARDLRGKAIA